MTDKTQPWGLPTIAAFGLLVVAPSSAMAQPSRTKPVVIRGSWGGLEVARRLTIEFMDASRQGEVRFLPCDSRQVADRLASRECDVGLVLHSLAPTTRDVVGEQFSVVHLGRFAVGIVVNKRNSVSSIATTQLGDVYRGKITSWSGVRTGRRVGQIEIYSLLLATTESHLVRHNTMQGEGFAQKLWDGWPEPSRQKLSASEVTAAVIEKPHAIGFFLLGPDTILDDRIRVLAIGGDQQTAVLPTLETIAEGTYPIIDQLTFFLHPDAP
ncbi:MAG: substrate-binding domain-containing protein, partial [Pirellulales bacterium]|nr:substrate-binding domain-containing protein [Pirellulales bacterium]